MDISVLMKNKTTQKLHKNYTETTLKLHRMGVYGFKGCCLTPIVCTAQEIFLHGAEKPFPPWERPLCGVNACCFLGASMLFPTRKDAFFDGQRASLQAK